MSTASDPDLLVLHGLRLKSFTPVAPIAEAAGLAIDDVAARLEQLAAEGWARHREGAVTGWSLTPAGRVEATRLVVAERDTAGARGAVEAAYEAFLGQNRRMLRVCTDWQLRPGPDGVPVTNDHADAAYDHGVVDELRAIDGVAHLVCADLHAALDRFGRYAGRFAHALRHVEAGEHEWFTKPVLDSYHTVWFELHEDLLVTLGRERSSERLA